MRQGLCARRQRSGRAHDRVCAPDNNALDAHMTRTGGTHDKDVCAIEEFYHDRGFSVATDLSNSQKKITPEFRASYI